MTGAQTAYLVIALVAPVVVVPIGTHRQTRTRASARLPPYRWAQLGALICGAAWLALVASGARGGVAGFHVSPLVAAAGCGAALLTMAALDDVRRPSQLSAMCVALTALGAAISSGGGGTPAAGLVGGLALAAIVTIDLHAETVRGSPGRNVPALLAAGGVVAFAVGFAVVHARSGHWALPTTASLSTAAIVAFLTGSALLAACATIGTEPVFRSGTEPASVLLAGGLAVGLLAAPLRTGVSEMGSAVVILATVAVAAAAVRRGSLSVALLALAAAAGPPALTPGSRLLAAAAVLCLAIDMPWAWLTAVPGAVSLATGVVDDGGRLATAAAVGAAAVAVLLAHACAEQSRSRGGRVSSRPDGSGPVGGGIPLATFPAAAIGAWLVVVPGTWTWTGAALVAYDEGTGRAVPAGLVVVLAYVLVGELRRRPQTAPGQLVLWTRSASTPGPRRATRSRSQRSRPFGRVSARPRASAKGPRRRRPRPPQT